MKILIGQSYFRALDPKELERKMPYPPLGALYAASILKQDHDVIFFDAMISRSPMEFILFIIETKPDLLLIYDDEFNYLTKMCLSNMREAALSFVTTAKTLSIPAVIYSSDATDFPDSYLNAGCDAIIYGEGEMTLQEVVESFEKNVRQLPDEKSKYEIDGLKFLHDGKLFTTPKRKLMENIDDLPDPDYSFVDMENYKRIWIENHGYFSLNISTTRGCPFRCNWCAKPLYGQTYNSRSPIRVAQQIKTLKEKYQVDHLWITDDIFGLKPNWINEFSNECKKLNIQVPYKCLSRPDLLLRGNAINDLKESGCEIIWIGAESGSPKILDAMEKGTSVEQIYNATEKIHQNGMKVAFFIQFGYTGETWEDIKLTRKMIRDCLPDDIGISVSYPLPGTKFYDTVKEQMKEKKTWKDSADLDMMFSGSYERSFYKLLHRFVHAEYRIFKYIKRKDLPAGRHVWNRFPKLIIQIIRFVRLRIWLINYIRKEKLSPL